MRMFRGPHLKTEFSCPYLEESLCVILAFRDSELKVALAPTYEDDHLKYLSSVGDNVPRSSYMVQ
jgi:hypothetical protein